jgi:signal transduction histidine kinase
MSCLLITSLTVSSFVSISTFSAAITEEVKHELTDHANNIMDSISEKLYDRILGIRVLSSRITDYYYAITNNYSGSNNIKNTTINLLNYLKQIQSGDILFDGLSIYNKNGRQIASTIVTTDNVSHHNDANNNINIINNNDDSKNANFDFLKRGTTNNEIYYDTKPIFVKVSHADKDGQPAIRFAAPIYENSAEITNNNNNDNSSRNVSKRNNDSINQILVGYYLLNKLTGFIKQDGNPSQSQLKDFQMYLIAPNGAVIYSNDNNSNNNTGQQSLHLALYSTDTNKKNYYHTSSLPESISFRNTSIYSQIKNSIKNVVSGIYPDISNNKEDAIFVAVKGKPFSSLQPDNNKNNISDEWTVIVSKKTKDAFVDLINVRNSFIFITVIILFASIAAIFVVSKALSQPIIRLKNATIALANGNFDKRRYYRIRNIAKSGAVDEIKELADQFEIMRNRIEKRTAELQKSNTELSYKEQELERANKLLLETDQAKDEFISMISHELKTPLVPIRGYAEMLLRAQIMGELNDKQKKAVSTILRSVEKQQQLVEEVLDVYKMDLGKLNMSKEMVKVDSLIEQTISDLKPLVSEKEVELKAATNEGKASIYCDPKRIQQVFSNLIKNSVDFVPEKKGRIILTAKEISSVEVGDPDNKNNNSKYNESSFVLFSVDDNGPGFPLEKVDNLFKKFYQIDTSALRKHGGSGLGLAICKGIVEAHGGKIWIDKEYRNGARVSFTIPSSYSIRKEENSINIHQK